MQTNQMNGLYPIIRRVRRPLLPADWPADAKPAASGGKQAARGEEPKQQQAKEKHEEATSTEPTK
jgi:hypothetical protein